MEDGLIARAQRGDAAAFETLMSAYEKKVYCLCLRMMGNPHDGEDAAQEAMLRIWQNIGRYRGESALSTWIYRVAASTCTDAIRKRARQSQPSLEALGEEGYDPKDDAPSPQEQAEESERDAAMRRAIDSVPEQMRSVFLLRDVHGLSVEATANALHLPRGTVKSRLARAREKVAAALLQSGLYDGANKKKGREVSA